jgi:hypothetical protein
MAEQSSVETGRAGLAAVSFPDRPREVGTASAPETVREAAQTDSPKLAPEPVKLEMSKPEPVRSGASISDAFRPDAPRMSAKLFATSPLNRSKDGKGASLRVEPGKPDPSKVDMSKVEVPRVGGKIGGSPVERAWDKGASLKVASEAGMAAQQQQAKPEAGKAAQQAKPDAAQANKTEVPKRSGSGIAGKILGAFSFGSLSLGSVSLRSLSLRSLSWPSFSLPSFSTEPSWAFWRGKAASPKPEARAASLAPERRRITSLAAVVVLAAVAGAVGGALATSVMTQLPLLPLEAATPSDNTTLEASVARIDADLQALKSGTDQTSQPGQIQGQIQGQGLDNQTSERLDRLERAEAESSAKIVRLNDATERLRAALQSTSGIAIPAPAAPRDSMGSVPQTTGSASSPPARPTTSPKAETGKMPVVQGWSVRDVSHGVAVIEGRNGFYEVYAGDPIPGLGRVNEIRRQDGRWVVVTTKGLVVSR